MQEDRPRGVRHTALRALLACCGALLGHLSIDVFAPGCSLDNLLLHSKHLLTALWWYRTAGLAVVMIVAFEVGYWFQWAKSDE